MVLYYFRDISGRTGMLDAYDVGEDANLRKGLVCVWPDNEAIGEFEVRF